MRRALALPVLLLALYAPQVGDASAQACIPDQHGALVCGEGKAAMRVLADTVSPSKAYAFAWRSGQGLTVSNPPPDGVENLLIRISDGTVLARLGGTYWATGEARANRYDLAAAWSPDNRSVVEVANSRWDSDSFAYYRIDDATAAKLDLRALVKPVLTARLPPRNRKGNSFRVRTDLPLTLDARGRLGFTAMLYVPKGETTNDYKVQVNIRTRGGKPSADVVSIRRVKAD
ncbi:hypothetical protein [Bradyrhizobium sp.]|uniref:hypothetical protein n=1 Tax=Bradyrhizobium sp. TaxID=376 RepID=UPI002C3B46AC|nr:hypothetical protein [Bradyrhizobium sp.]HMM90439.1 hypothetical protein [Bradyrhizobium sp.]